ncbi:MAG: glycoside hydrolase family 3 C-terminal domain-containing protein [Clostridium sp.]|nr:glycoside hydrolase family 3 C-terminal domain-containing protein [Bacteroides sp.]MCM1197363.1 glycoside hydrolase family 3 C-terminal domain-containing protein [Clostridium sp.]
MANILAVLAALFLAVPVPGKYPFMDSSLPVGQRLDDLVGRMTIEEKIDLLSGWRNFSLHPCERLGIPAFRMADGPLGIASWGEYGRATAFPAMLSLAASWDRELAAEAGGIYAEEWRARGLHFMLAPGVNMYRNSRSARNFEYFGEDPYLSSELSVPFIKAVQDGGVIATVKHFAANDQEFDRYHVSTEVSRRALHEIYFPPFRSAVQKAGVKAVMTGYNMVNGTYCTENSFLIDVLKKEWGFRGMLMSDWECTFSGNAAINGLDLEMGSHAWLTREKLLPMLADGLIDESMIDDKVRRIYGACMEMGFFDREQRIPEIPAFNPRANALSRRIAEEGIVLLKNSGGILPLCRDSVHRIAVIGPDACYRVITDCRTDVSSISYGGGGSSRVHPWYTVSPLEGVMREFPDAAVSYCEGISTEFRSSLFSKGGFVTSDGPEGIDGMSVRYFDGNPFDVTCRYPVYAGVEHALSHEWPLHPDNVSSDVYGAIWEGCIVPEKTDSLFLFADAQGGYRLYVDDLLVCDRASSPSFVSDVVPMYAESGQGIHLRMEYCSNRCLPGEIRLGYCYGSDFDFSDALRLASDADVVVFCAGLDGNIEKEGRDRPFSLTWGQDRLIRAIAGVNPDLIVTISAGGGVEMDSWIDSAAAVLHLSYPGQEGGNALASILSGKVNPGGRLPFSIERRIEDSPSYGFYDETRDKRKIHYDEGVFMGYRGYDRNNVKPLFPFGYGLSYTTFGYSDIDVRTLWKGRHTDEIAGTEEPVAEVCFTVSNTGDVYGSEVAQVYVHDIESRELRPLKELKGFEKVRLAPGESTAVRIILDASAFSYFSSRSGDWTFERGKFEIWVGSSSADIRLCAPIVF